MTETLSSMRPGAARRAPRQARTLCRVAACATWMFFAACIGRPVGEERAVEDLVELPSGVSVYARPGDPAAVAQGDPVLLVLGAAWLERDLAVEGAPTLYVDLPGRGRADARESTEASLAADLLELEALRARLGLRRVVLCGWSYYGGLAVRYALDHPEHVEALVLVAPLPPRRDPYWGDFVSRARVRTDRRSLQRIEAMRSGGAKSARPFEYCDEYTSLFVRSRTVDPEAVLVRMRSDPCVRPNLDPDTGAALGAQIVEGLGNWDWRADLAGLDRPVLVVHGREDSYPLEGSVEYAETLPTARLEIIESSGHLPWIEQPERFRTAVEGFLASL